MTTVVRPQNHPPPPLDQPTPQSPPYFKNQASNASPNPKQPPVMTATNTLTPASTGDSSLVRQDQEGDVMMEDTSYTQGAPHKRRRTSSAADTRAPTVAPGLRHRENGGDSAMSDTVPLVKPTIQELLSNPDVSPYHLVCQKPVAKSYPDMTEDLIELYGLKPIADKVARFDASGKKNKLRKSYKGFINGLPGKNDVEARPPSMGLQQHHDIGHLMMWPEEEWQNQMVAGKEVGKGIDLGKLRKGLAGMTKGDIPGFDASVLGLDDDAPRKSSQAASPALAAGTPRPNGSTPGNASTVSGGALGDDMRPQRKKKRRRYDEASYEGYEGFEGSEEGGTTTTNTGGGIGAGGGGGGWDPEKKKKKRKKNTDVNSPGNMNMPHRTQSPVQASVLYGR